VLYIGSIIEQAEALRHKEERKVIAGYASGRKAPEVSFDILCMVVSPWFLTFPRCSDMQTIDASESTASFLEAAGISAAAAGTSALVPGTSPYGPASTVVAAPPPVDGGVVPVMEWWDEPFLPKELRETRKKSVAAQLNDDYAAAALTNCKTFK
jgi:hypothetical protein